MSDILIKSRVIPSNPRSKNYPAGATVVRSGSGGGSTLITGGGGTNIDIIKVDDMRSLTDKMFFHLSEFLVKFYHGLLKMMTRQNFQRKTRYHHSGSLKK